MLKHLNVLLDHMKKMVQLLPYLPKCSAALKPSLGLTSLPEGGAHSLRSPSCLLSLPGACMFLFFLRVVISEALDFKQVSL